VLLIELRTNQSVHNI